MKKYKFFADEGDDYKLVEITEKPSRYSGVESKFSIVKEEEYIKKINLSADEGMRYIEVKRFYYDLIGKYRLGEDVLSNTFISNLVKKENDVEIIKKLLSEKITDISKNS